LKSGSDFDALKFATNPLGVTISVKAQAGARRSIVQGIEGEYLKVSLAAPPVDGRANEELIRLFSRMFGLAKSKIIIRRGLTSKRKVLFLEGCKEIHLSTFLRSIKEGKTKDSNGKLQSD
jgi:uncharacterized protein (TIGR00251 family)